MTLFQTTGSAGGSRFKRELSVEHNPMHGVGLCVVEA